ncbi:MAG: anti-sigma factor domain-containing protein [Methyloligellaceae bacterium]
MTKQDLDILASEYALGILDAGERAEAERLRASDAAFARMVSEWEQRLAPLSEAVTPIDPPASAWGKIEAALTSPAMAARQPLSELASQLAQLKRSIAAWRFAAMATAAAAVALAFVWIGGLESPFRRIAPEERYVAMLQSNAGETGFVITMNMKAKQFAIRPVAAKTPPAKSYELWAMMKDDNKPPMTLGIVQTRAYAMMDAPAEINHEMLEKGVQLAISLEPEGGAPAGKSMGPIMFAGLLMKQTP